MQMGANDPDGVISSAASTRTRRRIDDGRAGGLVNMYPNMP
jgi:hypothetical protein